MKITEKEFNAETGEETITEREETASEAAERIAIATARSQQVAAEQVVTDAKASRDAKLAKMGFTLAEIENW